MTDIVEFIQGRHSQAKLIEPAPAAAELEDLLKCAMRAPDHGMLRPWRYLVLTGEARHQLGQAWAEAMAEAETDATPAALEKARNCTARAPMIIVAVTSVKDHPKVPAIEQHISTGAGVAYLLLALQAQGYGGYWRTGAMAYDPKVKASLGLAEHEAITGFLYVGTPSSPGSAKPMPDLSEHVSYRH